MTELATCSISPTLSPTISPTIYPPSRPRSTPPHQHWRYNWIIITLPTPLSRAPRRIHPILSSFPSPSRRSPLIHPFRHFPWPFKLCLTLSTKCSNILIGGPVFLDRSLTGGRCRQISCFSVSRRHFKIEVAFYRGRHTPAPARAQSLHKLHHGFTCATSATKRSRRVR